MNHWEQTFTKEYWTELEARLEKLTPGGYISIVDISNEHKRNRLIAAIKCYIDNGHPEIYFTSDYSKAKKYEI